MLKQLLFVFLGGGIGSALRYIIGKNLNNYFPFGTFIVNILGSFLIGLILTIASKNNILTQNQTLFLATGFCGGFTTFSSFTLENSTFLKQGDIVNFILYTAFSFTIGLAAVFAGIWLGKTI